MKKYIKFGGALVGLALLVAATFPGYPTIPSGGETAITGIETIPMDTNLPQGQQPQTVVVTAAQLGSYAHGLAVGRNALIGGNFATNLWQRGTTSGDIANTLTYTADRFWAIGGASSAINVLKEVAAADVPSAQFGASMRFQRKAANADVVALCTGQTLTSLNSQPFAGQGYVYSFYAKKGANFSPALSDINVTVASGTGTDGAASGFAAGTQTGAASPTNAVSQVITTSWTRYSFSGTFASTATQVGVKKCFTPVGTAGANDWVEFAGEQLEIQAPGLTGPSAFNFVWASTDAQAQLAYTYVVAEPASTVAVAVGQATTTSIAKYTLQFPVKMRAVPTTTVVTGTFEAAIAGGTAATGCTFVAISSSNSVQVGGLSSGTCSSTPLVVGNASLLLGGGGTGSFTFSAEL